MGHSHVSRQSVGRDVSLVKTSVQLADASHPAYICSIISCCSGAEFKQQNSVSSFLDLHVNSMVDGPDAWCCQCAEKDARYVAWHGDLLKSQSAICITMCHQIVADEIQIS